jgi:formamidopyrimidine-DNA glycosylase
MPELPEVEHLRRSLDPVLVGARLHAVTVRRRSVISCDARDGHGLSPAERLSKALLVHRTIVATHRRGKQMALEADNGRVLVVQLGMTGSMTIEADAPPRGMDAKHRHVLWDFSPASPAGARWRLAFRDPRRFGGLTAYPDLGSLHEAWNALGPDALAITATDLATALARTRRPIKAALLDQALIAGVGNIYADEGLFAAGIHPLQAAASVGTDKVAELARHLRRILRHAVEQGGSTLRDYRDAFGQPGSAVQTHLAYGREGLPCAVCKETLVGTRVVGRATVFCPRCQDLSTMVGTTLSTKGGPTQRTSVRVRK